MFEHFLVKERRMSGSWKIKKSHSLILFAHFILFLCLSFYPLPEEFFSWKKQKKDESEKRKRKKEEKKERRRKEREKERKKNLQSFIDECLMTEDTGRKMYIEYILRQVWWWLTLSSLSLSLFFLSLFLSTRWIHLETCFMKEFFPETHPLLLLYCEWLDYSYYPVNG